MFILVKNRKNVTEKVTWNIQYIVEFLENIKLNVDAFFLYLVLFIALVIPQIQYESMGSPLRREAEEKEDELSQRNQMKPVKR